VRVVNFYKGEDISHQKMRLVSIAKAYDTELSVLALGSKTVITKASETPETQRIHL